MEINCEKCGLRLNHKGTGFRRYSVEACPRCAKHQWNAGFKEALKLAIKQVKPTAGEEDLP